MSEHDIPGKTLAAQQSTDLVRVGETRPAEQDGMGKLRGLIERALPTLLPEHVRAVFPFGVQYIIRGPELNADTPGAKALLESRSFCGCTKHDENGLKAVTPVLGYLSVDPNATPDTTTIEFYPINPDGKPFVIETGKNFSLTSDVNAGDLYDPLSVLFKDGISMTTEASTIHFEGGPSGPAINNLKFFNADGTYRSARQELTNTPQLPAGADRRKPNMNVTPELTTGSLDTTAYPIYPDFDHGK